MSLFLIYAKLLLQIFSSVSDGFDFFTIHVEELLNLKAASQKANKLFECVLFQIFLERTL